MDNDCEIMSALVAEMGILVSIQLHQIFAGAIPYEGNSLIVDSKIKGSGLFL